LLGRTFTPQEDLPHGGKVVVLSYGLWQRRFGGDRAIVGKSLSLGNEPYTIVGVVGKDFVFDPEADIWLPFQFPPISEDQNHYFLVSGMLKTGITVAQANAQLQTAAPQYHRDFPRANPRRQFAVEPLHDLTVGGAQFASGIAGGGQPGAADRVRQCCQSADGARDGTQARVRYPRRSRS
jgi:hypothetical protein